MNILNDNLIAVTDPVCNPTQCITGKGYRITVLTPMLIRVEKNINDVFNDKATQSIWYRNFDKPAFTYETNKSILSINTDKVTFLFNLKSLKVTEIIFKDSGKKVKCNNIHNLKGTARTLDMTFGAIPLHKGIMSKSGVSIYNDSKSLILDADGIIKPRETKVNDIYIFAYGNDYKKCLSDFFKLTGKVPLIPRYALGNWWSRYRAYTQEEYLTLMKKFIQEDIPISIATVDMDWHYVKINEKFGTDYKGRIGQSSGWTGYSWNSDLFPDYKGFLKWLQDHNMKVTLNLHPADGVRYFEDMYKEMANEMGIDPSTKAIINFNIASPDFINAYFKILHHPYEKDGVNFWWIDWQQGTNSGLKGLDPLWSLNHYHYLDNGSGKRPLILSRYAGVGSHRYPLGFSGDTAMNWRVLKFQPYFTATATNIGYTWWSHDIGGHHSGRRDDELYLRWLQFGVFSPILRLHSTSNDLLGKEPWRYRKDVEIFAVEQLRLRHKLIPYLYTMNYRTHIEDRALVEPMYYNYPDIEEAYNVPNQYYFGTELIVCPITEKLDKRINLSAVDTWLPVGRWTDIFTGVRYDGGKKIRMFRDINSIPVLAKEGAIIPLAETEGNFNGNPEKFSILAYRGNSDFSMYEDDSNDNGYLNGHSAKTTFRISEKDRTVTFTIDKAIGDLNVIPKKRTYKIIFKDIIKAETISLMINDKPLLNPTVENEENITIILKDIKQTDKVEITLSGINVIENISYSEAAINMLSRYQGNNLRKILIYRKLKHKVTREEYIRKLNKLLIPRIVKDAINEYLN